MKRIEKLTKKQEAQMASYAKKWIDIGLKTGETDWKTFDKYMPICYEKAGLTYPKNIVRVSSPLVGGLASAIAEVIIRKNTGAVSGAVDGAVRDAVDGAVGDAVRDAVDGAVGGAVSGAVGGAVSGAVGGAVSDAVDGAVRDAVDGAVGDAVGDAVDGAVGGAVSGAVGDAVGGAVSGAVELISKLGLSVSWHYWLGGQFWVGGWYWGNAFVSFFFDVCKLKLSKDIMERAVAYRKVNESVNYIWPNRNFVMVCARPTKIERNERGMLHCENGKAIEYPDGWGLYYLNGVKFDETLYKKVISPEFTYAERMAIVDIDQRTQALNPRFCDLNAFVKEANGKVVDTYVKEGKGYNVKYELYLFPAGSIFREDAYYCSFNCPSTGKMHMEGVEKSETVADAMAWSMGITSKEWKSLIPLTHEN